MVCVAHATVEGSLAGCSGRDVQHPTRFYGPRRCTRSRQRTSVMATQDFGETVQRMARQVQGALPVVGLLSRILTPTGGVGNDELSYPDYCRALYEEGIEPLNIACVDFERKYGKGTCGMRNVLFCIWTCKDVGLVQPKAIMSAVRRLRVTSDMEVECDRFEAAKQETISKYSYLDRPRGSAQQQAELAVDALACLAGLADGASIDGELAAMLEPIMVHGLFFQSKVPVEDRHAAVQQAIATRASRAKTYLA